MSKIADTSFLTLFAATALPFVSNFETESFMRLMSSSLMNFMFISSVEVNFVAGLL